MTEQFAVVWKRVGIRAKRRLFAKRKSAERWLTMLGPEPWLAFGKQADERCCDGYDCGCEGKTPREQAAELRARYPAIEYARIEVRDVSEWRQP